MENDKVLKWLMKEVKGSKNILFLPVVKDPTALQAMDLEDAQ